jgi:broad specificity phosphatase PhoE
MILLSALLIAQLATAQPTSAEPTTIILVRHAEKAEGDAKDPGLTAQGQARAEALAEALADKKLRAIIVSDTRRARDTAEPTAKAQGLQPMVVSTAGGGEAHVKGVVNAIRKSQPGGTILVVGHSNTLAPIIEALGGPHVPALCEKQFAPMYVLEIREKAGPELATKAYGAPDPAGSEKCAP